MDFAAALGWLENLSRFGVRLGLERMAYLLEALGHPEEAVPVIHVAGTNGKGSTAAMIAAVLQEAGYRVGLYTSPHLECYTERIRLDGRPIPPERFAALVEEIQPIVAAGVASGLEHPTEFEVGTAIMYRYFAAVGADVIVQETGLGGRLDSTNLVRRPLVAVITPVDLDHTDRLGPTVADIAREKAGILKPGRPAVLAPQAPEVRALLGEAASRLGCPLTIVGEDVRYRTRSIALGGGVMDYHGRAWQYEALRVGLSGVHQLGNAACALAALEVVEAQGFHVPEEAVRRGLASVRWPGRLEVVRTAPLVILDGAHNPAGARSLRAALEEFLPGRRLVLVCGMLADKDAAGALAEMAAPAAEVVATRPDSPRALPPAELARLVPGADTGACPVHVIADPLEAVALAMRRAGPRGAVCVAGSLYLVGLVRAHLRGSKGRQSSLAGWQP